MRHDDQDPRFKHHGPMDPRLWQGRHYGDSGTYAHDCAKRLGGGAIVVQHGDFSWAVYQPRYTELSLDLTDGAVTLEPQMIEGEWQIVSKVNGNTALVMTAESIERIMNHLLPDALALLKSLNAAAPRTRGNVTGQGRGAGPVRDVDSNL
jgi:hypothetical protein